MVRNLRVLDDEALKDLKSATWGRSKKSLSASTEKRYSDAQRDWLRFLGALGYSRHGAASTLCDGAPLPLPNLVKQYLKWYTKTAVGIIDKEKKVPTQNTVEHASHTLTTMLQRETGNKYNQVQMNDFIEFIRDDLRRECGVKHVTKPKRYADEVDLEIMLDQLWLTLFLALAFADKVYKNVSNLQQLLDKCQSVQAGQCREIPLKSDKGECAIFKTPSEKGRRIGVDLCFGYDAWGRGLKSVSIRAGYSGYHRPYSIRFGSANRLHETHSGEAADRQLGHVRGSNTFAKHYADSLIPCDLQAHMSGEKGFSDLALFRRVQRRIQMPVHLPSRYLQSINTDPEVLSLEGEARYQARDKLVQASWIHLCAQWDEGDTYVDSLGKKLAREALPRSIERYGDLRQRATRAAILHQYDMGRNKISHAFSSGCNGSRDTAVLDALIELATQAKPPPFFFEGDSQIEHFCKRPSKCRDVGECVHMDTRVRRINEAKANGRCVPEFCRRCDEWFSTGKDFEAHLQAHFEAEDPFCGMIKMRGLMVTGARCPFCMSSAQLTWRHRMAEFGDKRSLLRHLCTHVEAHDKESPIKCPHPACSLAADMSCREDLLHHLYDTHGLIEVHELLNERPKAYIRDIIARSVKEVQERESARDGFVLDDLSCDPKLPCTSFGHKTWEFKEERPWAPEFEEELRSATALAKADGKSAGHKFILDDSSYDPSLAHTSFRLAQTQKAQPKKVTGSKKGSPRKRRKGFHDLNVLDYEKLLHEQEMLLTRA
ncbi:MAG: hypothetical protein Q9162_002355 [Coniocarpon cinnabarinum]